MRHYGQLYHYDYQGDEDLRPTEADLREELTDEEAEERQAERDLADLNAAEGAEIRRGIR